MPIIPDRYGLIDKHLNKPHSILKLLTGLTIAARLLFSWKPGSFRSAGPYCLFTFFSYWWIVGLFDQWLFAGWLVYVLLYPTYFALFYQNGSLIGIIYYIQISFTWTIRAGKKTKLRLFHAIDGRVIGHSNPPGGHRDIKVPFCRLPRSLRGDHF